jgi:hypothetical protein
MPDLRDTLAELTDAYARQAIAPGVTTVRRQVRRRRRQHAAAVGLAAAMLVTATAGPHLLAGGRVHPVRPAAAPPTTLQRSEPAVLSAAELRRELPWVADSMEVGQTRLTGPAVVVRGSYRGYRWLFVVARVTEQIGGQQLPGDDQGQPLWRCYLGDQVGNMAAGGFCDPFTVIHVGDGYVRVGPGRLGSSSIPLAGVDLWYGMAPKAATQVRVEATASQPAVRFATIDPGHGVPATVWLGFSPSSGERRQLSALDDAGRVLAQTSPSPPATPSTRRP